MCREMELVRLCGFRIDVQCSRCAVVCWSFWFSIQIVFFVFIIIFFFEVRCLFCFGLFHAWCMVGEFLLSLVIFSLSLVL